MWPNERILLKTRETRRIPGSHEFLMASTREEENSFFTIEGVINSLGWRAYITVQTHTRVYLNCVGAHPG